MTRLPSTSLLVLLLLAFAPLGCSLQGKGQYCDSRYKNGSLDCDTAQGLVCNDSHVCCPPNDNSNICNPGVLTGASTGGAGGNGAGGNGAGGNGAGGNGAGGGASSSASSTSGSTTSTSTSTSGSTTSTSTSGGGGAGGAGNADGGV